MSGLVWCLTTKLKLFPPSPTTTWYRNYPPAFSLRRIVSPEIFHDDILLQVLLVGPKRSSQLQTSLGGPRDPPNPPPEDQDNSLSLILNGRLMRLV